MDVARTDDSKLGLSRCHYSSCSTSIASASSDPRKGLSSSKSIERRGSSAGDGIVGRYVDVLHNKCLQALALGLFAVHLVAAIYCCTLVNTDFDMENLYLRGSPLNPISSKMQKFILNESFVVNFMAKDVDWPATFAQRPVRSQFNAMINELEQILPFGFGSSRGTMLWTRDYEAVGDRQLHVLALVLL